MSKDKIIFNEMTRVQIPAMVHLTRLGYQYFGKIHENDKNVVYDPETNILLKVFQKQFYKLNPNSNKNPQEILQDIKHELKYNDLGKSFYERLTSSQTKLIDFDNIENNIFQFTAEFTYENNGESFRPDITLFVNGLPLCYIEVKKPNNKNGIFAELERMNNVRFKQEKFKRFNNITQLMIFSNNMEYDILDDSINIQGTYYCTGSKDKTFFNLFREEPINNNPNAFFENFDYRQIDQNIEEQIFRDFHIDSTNILSNEYKTNLEFTTPTNKIITSLCSKERFLFLLKYGIAYVNITKEIDGEQKNINQKHIIRYQQLFALFAIKDKIEKGNKSGVIWHTQGSGKTALSYFAIKYLTNYYAKKNIVAMFYFIVDRIDLLEQSTQEFEARGLKVYIPKNKEELMNHFKENTSFSSKNGQTSVVVVNIHRFSSDDAPKKIQLYNTSFQRFFIIDEAHRGYKPHGNFLANLIEADPNSIKIALTGTPILKEDVASSKVFSNYFHTYYYDKSIKDGYTLKIMREDIEATAKQHLNSIYDKVVKKGSIQKSKVIEHPSYVKELAKYVVNDLSEFRKLWDEDPMIKGMVVCETSEQAKEIDKFLHDDNFWNEITSTNPEIKRFNACLILHDVGDKESRKKWIKDFKRTTNIDLLIVYNMLLTGFDAPPLKRLYLGRKLSGHTLLQALTRVNRPFKDMNYGYVVDFADIKKNFEQTNQAYLEELGKLQGDDSRAINLNDYLVDKDEIIVKIDKARNKLFEFDITNLEEFEKQINLIQDKSKLIDLKNSLKDALDGFNIIRSFGSEGIKELFKNLKINNLTKIIKQVFNRIQMLNTKTRLKNQNDSNIDKDINDILSGIQFSFEKKGEEELKIISKDEFSKKAYEFSNLSTQVINKESPEYLSIYEELREIFNKKGFVIESVQEFNELEKKLNNSIQKIQLLLKKEESKLKKVNNDPKFLIVLAKIEDLNKKKEQENQSQILNGNNDKICEMLVKVKKGIDSIVEKNNNILNQKVAFEKEVRVIFTKIITEPGHNSQIEKNDKNFIINEITNQYSNTKER